METLNLLLKKRKMPDFINVCAKILFFDFKVAMTLMMIIVIDSVQM